MEASESSVVESPTEPSSAPVASEVPIEQAPEAPVITETILAPSAPFPMPEPAPGEVDPVPVAPAMTPGKIELSTGKQHDIQDIQSLQGLSVQAGAGFTELTRVDGKPIWVAADKVVSYE